MFPQGVGAMGGGGGGGYSASTSSTAKTGDINANSVFNSGDFAVGAGAANGINNKMLMIIGGAALLGLLVWKKA